MLEGRRVFGGGDYRLWLRGTLGRPMDILVDDRRVARLGAVNAPGGWLGGDVVRVPPGEHRLGVRRGGVRLPPGDGYVGVAGPLVFEPVAGRSLESVPRRRARELCGRRLDWIERVAD